MVSGLDLLVIASAILLGLVIKWKQQATVYHFPPGPPSDLLIGHARKIPLSKPWKVYAEWYRTYGDVIYTYALGRSIVVLNSVTAARDLLEKKSLSFSDRPYIPLIQLMGWGNILPLLGYGVRFRKHRRIMHQYFGPQTSASFRPMQEHEISKFLRLLLESPDGFLGHIHGLIAGIVVLITYGHEVVSNDDAYVELVERAVYMTSSSGSLGTTIIDFFPFLRHVPAWLPGMGLKRLAAKTRKVVRSVMTVPLDELKAKRTAGSNPPCLISDLLDEYEGTGVVDKEHEEDIMNIGVTIYNAGTDTTKSTLTTFFLLMTLHSDVAKRAQDEIDRVTGMDRLPTIDDRDNLPYIDCILTELYRIYPALPLGIPHRSTQTEAYREWTIPEGTMAIANIWQMMRNEDVFAKPEVFDPERHASKQDIRKASLAGETTVTPEDDPSSIVFGFGRRVCPGKYFADQILWMTMVNVLAIFDIRPYTNPATGIDELPKFEFENEIILSPKPFKCMIVPRNAKLAQMIRSEVHD